MQDKAFDKIQHPFMIKTLESGYRGNIPQCSTWIFFSLRKWKKVKLLSRVRLFATPRTVAYQAPLYMEFSRQEYLSGCPFSSSGDLPDPGIEPGSPALQADSLPSEPPGKPWGWGKERLRFYRVNFNTHLNLPSSSQMTVSEWGAH